MLLEGLYNRLYLNRGVHFLYHFDVFEQCKLPILLQVVTLKQIEQVQVVIVNGIHQLLYWVHDVNWLQDWRWVRVSLSGHKLLKSGLGLLLRMRFNLQVSSISLRRSCGASS